MANYYWPRKHYMDWDNISVVDGEGNWKSRFLIAIVLEIALINFNVFIYFIVFKIY